MAAAAFEAEARLLRAVPALYDNGHRAEADAALAVLAAEALADRCQARGDTAAAARLVALAQSVAAQLWLRPPSTPYAWGGRRTA